jgi:superfamily II DNA or RNA helicase
MAGLERLLEGLDPDERRRGKQFERIVEWFLTHAPEYKNRLSQVWLWDDWPDRPSRDLGIDLVAQDSTGGFWAIQAKAYSPDYSVTKRDIDSFLSASASGDFSYRLLVATTDRIAANARLTIEHQAIQVGTLLRSELAAVELNWPETPNRLSAPKPPRKRLRADQREAVREVVAGFEQADRGRMIRACGTGKTLIALGVREQLGARRTLVLVPSLSLLKQTLQEWSSNARRPFELLAVCSDETVATHDAPVAWTHDLGLPVTTDPTEIAAFLRRRGDLVVFSTYQSSPQLAEAYEEQPRTPAFNLAVCDEAHRCAGRVNSAFATILDAKRIHAQRRLFMTATPRYFTGRFIREAQTADFEIASMDDASTFGPLLHRLSFAQAIDRDLLSDYQVAIVGVNDITYKSWAERGQFVTRDGEKITDARTLAGQIGLAKAMRRFDLRRVISFHSRIAAARRFSTELPDVIAWMPSTQRPTGAIFAAYVSGEMDTGKRNRRLNFLKDPPAGARALLSNARCLAEGVDVPTLDGVAFIDPRRSEVDIVQAVGRAIRKAEDKTIGTIVLPVFISQSDDPEQRLNDSTFKPIWDVIRALRSHDEQLGNELDALRRAIGRGSSGFRRPSKIELYLPDKVSIEFSKAFDARLVEQTTTSWEAWYGLLEAFTARHGNALVPTDHVEEGRRLGNWTHMQRRAYATGDLRNDQIRRLEALSGWSWQPYADQWDEGYAYLEAFSRLKRHTRVPASHVENGFALGNWVGAQRAKYSRSALRPDRARKLESLPGWSWRPQDDDWEKAFQRLARYVEREGDARVPSSSQAADGFQLGAWVKKQRSRRPTLPTERVQRLESLPGWSWDSLADRWEENYAALQDVVARQGHADSLYKAVEGERALGTWVNKQRKLYASSALSEDRIGRLEAVPGWSWAPRADQWTDAFAYLESFVGREHHARVPVDHEENGFRLGQWVTVQRHSFSGSKLGEDRVQRLESLPGWSWDPQTDKWEDGYRRLRNYADHQGAAQLANDLVVDEYPLGAWAARQRSQYARAALDDDRVLRLEAIPGWTWDPRADQWEDGYARLEAFVAREGSARVPAKRVEAGYRLGAWVTKQRANRSRLAADRIKRLETLPGWSWDPHGDRWNDAFAKLRSFISREGNADVPKEHVEGDFLLGRWVAFQRHRYGQSKLAADRVRLLESIPEWTWGGDEKPA